MRILLVTLLLSACFHAHADDLFKIHGIRFLEEPTEDQRGIFTIGQDPITKRPVKTDFHKCLEVEVGAESTMRTEDLIARVYCFDSRRRPIGKVMAPAKVERGTVIGRSRSFAWPPRVGPSKENLYFAMPPKVLQTDRWTALVVFGDREGATAQTFPVTDNVSAYNFPDAKLVELKVGVQRRAIKPELIEHVQRTGVRQHPRITFFVRIPEGCDNLEQTNGTLAICGLGSDVDHIKRQLDGDVKEIERYLSFADKHGLAILFWGSRNNWDAARNWDEYAERDYQRMDDVLSGIADAWAEAVDELSRVHGLVDEDMLLASSSGAAQFALRLALRKPGYFLAVHASIPSSFDKPTPDGRQVLWCLTTGELESGYGRSLRFLEACRQLGYPIIYKAEMGVAHVQTTRTKEVGRLFFEYALSIRELRQEKIDELRRDSHRLGFTASQQPKRPWLEDFINPEYIADAVNQEIYAGEDADMVPEPFRVPLPNKQFADLWRDSY